MHARRRCTSHVSPFPFPVLPAPSSMFLPSRGRQGPDPYLRVRTALFLVGVGFILAGAQAQRRWAVWVGIGVLLVAVVVRLFTRTRSDDEAEQDETDGRMNG